MIRALVDFALNNKFVVLAITGLLLAWGAVSFHNLPVEAYPDIADNYVTIITQWPGRAAEEVEQQVTIPVEIQMNGIPHLSHLRSESIFGLSFVLLIFDDQSDNDWNRQKVLERLSQVDLPGVVVGAGGVTHTAVALQCLDAGAQFLTSDGLHPEVIELAAKQDVVVIPGALTPTEVITAWRASSDFVKVVPCAQIGGETYIASLSRMYPHIPLIASGGVTQQNASKFILAGAMALGVGRELIPPEAIRLRQLDRIGELARRFVGFVKNGRDHLAARKSRRMAIDE